MSTALLSAGQRLCRSFAFWRAERVGRRRALLAVAVAVMLMSSLAKTGAAKAALPDGWFTSVSCPSRSACTAVGAQARGIRVLAEQWNGRRWAAGPPSQLGALGAVSCWSPRGCVAVGWGYSGADDQYGHELIERWNGVKWTVERGTNAYDRSDLFPGPSAVSCSSARMCFSVGTTFTFGEDAEFDYAVTERWTGTRWVSERPAYPRKQPNASLADVSCPPRGACTAVGYSYDVNIGPLDRPLLERWIGSRWRTVRAPVPRKAQNASFDSVSCPSRTTCVVLGSRDTRHGRQLFADQWHGSRWTTTPAPVAIKGGFPVSDTGTVTQLSCFSITACTATTEALENRGDGTPKANVLERWNGSRWTLQRITAFAGRSRVSLSDVSCPGRLDCTVVGTLAGRPLAERWLPRWVIQPTPLPATLAR